MSGSIAPLGACSNIVAEALSPFAVGSCCCSSQQGGTGLELEVGLASLSMDPMVSGDPQVPPVPTPQSQRTLPRQLLLGGGVQASIQKKA